MNFRLTSTNVTDQIWQNLANRFRLLGVKENPEREHISSFGLKLDQTVSDDN